jgi:hypothetical protein
MEQAPVTQMSPELVAPNDQKKLATNLYIFSKPGAYYLAYVAEAGHDIELNLPGTKEYTVEVLDTWNMKTIEKSVAKPGVFKYKTKVPYTAVRLVAE